MSIMWFDKPKDLIVTLSPSNITLNKQATEYFCDANAVMLGIDKDNNQVLIKPLNRMEVEKEMMKDKSFYKITVRSSYSRVVNKAFNEMVYNAFNISSDEILKLRASWNDKERILKINIKEVQS